jgi:hypothetical protein
LRSAVGVERLGIRLLREECQVVGATAIERYSSSVERARHDQTPIVRPLCMNCLDVPIVLIATSLRLSVLVPRPDRLHATLELCDVMGLVRAKEASLLCRIRRR